MRALLFLFLVAAAASPVTVAAIKALADQDIRVATISHRLARGGFDGAGPAICNGTLSAPGLVLQDIAQYPQSARAAARTALRLGDGATVVAVLPGTTAAAAGFQPGDVIATVNGTTTDMTIARDSYTRVQQAETTIETAMAAGTATVVVRRGGGTVTLHYNAERGCSSRVQIVTGRALNALADGHYVQISAAMVAFAGENDDALATVIAHEIAHNVLRHQANKTPSRQAEYEADRLGAWLVARAGYDIDAVVPFWTRLGQRTGLGILSDGSHPRWKPRIAAVAAAVAQIKAKLGAGQPLAPIAPEMPGEAGDKR